MAANCIRIPIRSWLAILLIAAGGPAFALDPSLRLSQYVLDNWQIPDGLPQSSAQAIARTPDGYLWVGTQEGLARFDGVRFTVFNGENEVGIPNKYISVLNVDRDGRLWIGTRSGITVLEKGHFTPYLGNDRLAHAYVHAIVEDKSGHMWVGTESGLFEIAGRGRASTFDASSGLRDVRIQSLLEDRDGMLWVGTAGGLQRFDGKRFDTVPLGNVANAPVTSLHADTDGTLWIGTGNGALYRRSGERLDVVAAPGRLGSLVSALAAITTATCGSGRAAEGWCDGETEISTRSPAISLPPAICSRCWRTRRGVCGSAVTALGCFACATVNSHRPASPRACDGNLTWTMAPRQRGGLWVGSDGGLSSYVDGRFQHIAGPQRA